MHYFRLIQQPFILTPHWFDDTFKSQRVQPVERYLFPDPLVFRSELSTFSAMSLIENSKKDAGGQRAVDKLRRVLTGEVTLPKTRTDVESKEERLAVWKSVAASDPASFTLPSAANDDDASASANVWGARRILLSADLKLANGRRESVAANIRAGGGVVVELPTDDRLIDLDEYDVLIVLHNDTLECADVSCLAWLHLSRLSEHFVPRRRKPKN